MQEIKGLHLLMDGYVEHQATLEPGHIIELFDKLVTCLGMEYLVPPVATRVPLQPEKLAGGDDEGGWSVFCQITTSHIALHGWPLRRAFMLDVFSCKDFDHEAAVRLIYEHLRVTTECHHVVDRLGPWPPD